MTDRFDRNINYMRVSVTEQCNLRCRYCMPENGICAQNADKLLTEEETVTAIMAAASLGITKIRITGGEPLIKENIVSLCRRAAETDGIEEVCLTTNGIRLPQLSRKLKEAGVRRVNISLDTLNADKFRYISRGGELSRVLAGIDAALGEGFEKVKLNTVLIGGFNDDEVEALAALTIKYPVDVRFIELMPMCDGGFDERAYIPCSSVLENLPQAEEKAPDGGVAKLYALPGAQGNIGLISPVSAHFCASCSRIRLTADGKLKPCLHSGDEYSVKGLDYEEMVKRMEEAIMAKPSWHGALSAAQHSRAGRSMNRIGG